jgi:hypothetical protein
MSDNDGVPWGERPAVAAPPGLLARYQDDSHKGGLTTEIYAFSVEGHPLVLGLNRRLVRADRPELVGSKLPYAGIDVRLGGPPLAGPFTPAPTGMVAVFSDGREQPVLFYDVHGRVALMNLDDPCCDLVLAETLPDMRRVEFRPASGEPAPI